MIELLTQAEVAKLLRVSERTVARLRASGKLPYVPGRPVRIKLSALTKYVESLETFKCPTLSTQGLKNLGQGRGKSDGPSAAKADPSQKHYRRGRQIASLRKNSSRGS